MKTNGFTLLELLVTLTIVSIITAIAIPQYQEYRRRGFDVRASSDLRNIAIAQEAHFLEHEHYLSCQDDACTALPGIAAISAGVTITIAAKEASFTGQASHKNGSGRVFHWDSERGGLQS